MLRGRKKQSKQLRQKQDNNKKELKQEQRLSNQLKKPKRGGEELKKLELREWKKRQAIWSQSVLISHGGTNCSIEISLEKDTLAS